MHIRRFFLQAFVCAMVLTLLTGGLPRVMGSDLKIAFGLGNSLRHKSNNRQIRQRLQTAVLVNFHHTPLLAAVRALGRTAGIPLAIANTALIQAGVDPRLTITLAPGHPITVAAALRGVLAQATIQGGIPVVYSLYHGLLAVGPKNAIRHLVVARIYRLAPLLVTNSAAGPYESAYHRQIRRIVYLFINDVDRNAWIINGGALNQYKFVNGLLVVVACQRDQRRIRLLLEAMARQAHKLNKLTNPQSRPASERPF